MKTLIMNELIYAPNKPFTGFKVAPCKMIGRDDVTICDPGEDPEFWGLYATDGMEDEWIADFLTEDQANAFREFLETVVSNYSYKVFSEPLIPFKK